MVDPYLRQSPLAHLHLDARAANDADLVGAGLRLSERAHLGMINVRGVAADPAFAPAFKKATGVELPTAANTTAGKADGVHAIWLGPDEWLVITPPGREHALADKLRAATKALHAAVTVTGEARTVIRVAGANARDAIAKGCPLDLHPRVFGPGQCGQTILGRADMLIHQPALDRKSGAPSYDVFVLRSFAEYAWTWLEDAGREYGVQVVAAKG